MRLWEGDLNEVEVWLKGIVCECGVGGLGKGENGMRRMVYMGEWYKGK